MGQDYTKKSTKCPISREQFAAKATKHKLDLREAGSSDVLSTIDLDVHQFSTGSLGWYANGKVKMVVDGVECVVQVGLNFTIVGSKELPAIQQQAAA